MSDYSDLIPAPTPEPSPAPTPAPRAFDWRDWLMPVVALVAIGVLITVAALIVPRLRPQPHSGDGSALFPKRLTFTSPLAPQAYTPLLAVEGQARVPAIPRALDVAGTSFVVVPVLPELGHWPVPEDAHQAGWLYGTLVNYVLGAPYTEASAALLQGLDASAVLTLTLDNGVALTFGSPQVALRAPEASLWEQRQPGLTLVLLGGPEGEQRWVLRAPYLPSTGVLVGQTQAVGEALLTVTRVELVERKPERYLVVDYQLSHNGTEALDPALLTLTLEDGSGARYQPDATFVAEGHPAPLSASVAPGMAVAGSASYRLNGEPVLPFAWVVRWGGESGPTVRFPLGYVPPVPAPAQAVVSVKQALYEPERNALRILGTVRNVGEQTLTVNGTLIRLTSERGEATLRSFSPLLPWSLAANEQEEFEVVFDRPTGVNEVSFEMLGFVFQISGLP